MSARIESEKTLERSLSQRVKARGGWSIKLLSTFITGLPDRMILLPVGIMFFVELKTTGKKPTPPQLFVHEKLRRLGFIVYVIDSTEAIDRIL